MNEVAPVFAHLQVLNLASVDVTEQDITGLDFLCGSLSANPSVDQVDLDFNFFGES